MSTAVKLKMTITEELEEIAKDNRGKVRPIDVVEYARDPETTLHGQFTWDDSDAAQRYRLWQARQVLSVYVKMDARGSKDANIRVFVSLPKDRTEGNGYRSLATVMKSKAYRAQLLEMALSELQVFRHNQRYKLLTELLPIWTAIDKIIKG